MSVVEMTSSSSSMMITGDAFEAVDFFSSDSDTDSWQVVDDPFDSENDDVITTESDVITSDEDEVDEENEDEDVGDVITSENEEEGEVDEITNHTQNQELIDHKAAVELDNLINGEGAEIWDAMNEDALMERMLRARVMDNVEEEEEDEDEDDYDQDLDDELVPRWLSKKFERQRMRKLGKKVYPKMKKSKRVVNQYNRPGCAGAKFQMW